MSAEPVGDRPSPRLPGDLILDRYLPNATHEKRAEAREALREYALFLLRIGERVWNERATETRSSLPSDSNPP